MNVIYWILGLPHVLCYMIYRHIIKEIDEDLATYTSGRVGASALIFALVYVAVEKNIVMFFTTDCH